ncbi:MAG: hypothetical protein EB000_04000, partial [Alphaproteobacteria bacterium]|nr:hypothetical protein [Alphaproteobacteria bacterium]
RNNAGGAITIVNISADLNGNNFAGSTSVTSLSENTSANTTTSALRLMRLDGGPLTIRDFAGSFLDTAGVLSGQNGRYALGLNIEQGIRSGGTAVVANIIARDALNALVGDHCYVIDDGNGDWATFTYDGTQWTKVGGQRSVATDARTLVLDVDLSTTTGIQSIGFITVDRTVISVRVLVTTSASADAQVTIGTRANTSMFTQSRDSILGQ